MISRNKIRQQRKMLSSAERKQAANALSRQLVISPLFLRSQRIACYFASDGEMDLQPVINRIWEMGKHCYLPVISQTTHNRLGFAPYLEHETLNKNQYGIPEPRICRHHQTAPWAVNLLLLPLVAFDNSGNRLGMGGGYYDRTLAYLRRRSSWHRPVLIGVAYDFQKVEELTSKPWDIPLDGVLTESGISWF